MNGHDDFGTIAKRARGVRLLGRLDLQIAFCAYRGLAAFGDVALTVEHEADGTFAVRLGTSRIGAFESRSETAVADQTADLFGVPFTGWIEARGLACRV